MYARAGLEGHGLGAHAPQIREAGDEPERRALGTRPAEDLAARKVARAVAHDVERHALSGQRPRSIAMHLNRAHAAAHARGTRNELIAHRHRGIVKRARDDRPGSL